LATPNADPRRLTEIPPPLRLWRAVSTWAWVVFGFLIVEAVPHFIVQYWFNQSLGYRSIFWTNLWTQTALFVPYGGLLFLAIWLPVRRYAKSPGLDRVARDLGIWGGTVGGWLFAGQYQQALLAFHGVPFGRLDPVFGHDIGFYVYVLPFLEASLSAVAVLALVATASCAVAGWNRLRVEGRAHERLSAPRHRTSGLAALMTTSLGLFGLALAARTYLSRYALLLRDNGRSGVRAGAEYLDVTGFFSTVHYVTVTTAVEIGLTAVVCFALVRWTRAGEAGVRTSLRGPGRWAGALLALELAFFLGLVVRDHVLVSPNEPVIQRDFIQRHMEATLRGYRLDRIEVHEWIPPSDPIPHAELLASKTLENAPFLPAWVSYLEEPPDIQHFERIALSESKMVYGPLLRIYDQQQKLRPYYDFLSVDPVRYTVGGEKRMYATAARELPSVAFVGSQEWLRYWGSAALMYTHGMGLVMSPVNQIDANGNPLYVSENIPPVVADEAFAHEPRIYFGEALKDDYVLTDVRGLRELDYATEQFREEFTFPADLVDGIRVDSWFRRLVFAIYTGDYTAFLFSRYIDHAKTRVHIRRTPLTRAASIAPFLFLDSNIFAFIAGGRTQWMINGLTTTDRYPYSFPETLGDKSDERAVERVPERKINYAEDAVKITLDAESGEIRFFKVANDPIVDTWDRIYGDLFEPGEAMPAPARAQLTYPLQWFHIQFDDIYKRYHQRDPIEFYNVEDLWDDADETLGSIGRGLSGFGTTDQMTFSYEGYDALLDPADLPPGVDVGEPGALQFARLMPFTPDGARNLRSLIVAFQDPENYGRLLSLQIPQGSFIPGPEQVDAYIDNDRPVHQQVTMWIRHGSEVIRGSTLLLPVRGDLIYLETIWVNSLQNDLPQLKLFAVHYHDRITSAPTLEEAIGRREFLEDP